MNAKKIRSWDGTHVWIPEKIYNLKDKEKIAKQIKRAVEEEKRTEAIGRALSWSDIILSRCSKFFSFSVKHLK